MQKQRKYIEKCRAPDEHNLNSEYGHCENEFVVLTGLSGSGKSSLHSIQLYAEGQRRYMESLSSYARRSA